MGEAATTTVAGTMDCAAPARPDPRETARLTDVACCVHPYTNLRNHLAAGPMVIERGEGVFVYDDQGRKYLEGLSGLWCAALGFSERRLADAAHRAMTTLPFYHGFGGKASRPMIELAAALIEMAPAPMSKAFFANSGSEANDTAIKLVWCYNAVRGRPEKRKIIARHRGYHGVTVGTASLTGLPANHAWFNLPLDFALHAACPHHWRSGLPGENEEAFSARLARELEDLVLREGPETIAAFIAEPVMGAGGVIVPPRGYFEAIQAVLRRYDILMIADEVICGFGRTGRWWGSETYGVAPDLLTCAKALSSGYAPISAVMISEPIWLALLEASDRAGVFGHGYTYSGHPVAASVALEALAIYRERDILGHVSTVAPVLQAGLRRLGAHPLVGEARGVGLVGALELAADREARRSFPPEAGVAACVARRAEARGLIVRPLSGDVIAVCPPLIIDEAEVGLLLDRLEGALDDAEQWIRSGEAGV